MFLLDTNVVSETRRLKPHGAVLAWLRATPDESLHLSAVTLGELQAGVENIREQDPARAIEIESWLDQIAESYNILSMDGRIFRCWARLTSCCANAPLEDAMIAATATVYNLTVVTRNTRDFTPFGVALLNPFENARH